MPLGPRAFARAPKLEEPTAHVLTPRSGALGAASAAYEKRIEDLAGIYADQDAFAASCADRPGQIIYRVEDVRPAVASGGLIFGTTYMAPGRIGAEFFVTRGHIHAIANRPETYRGERGQGLMLLESPEGETRILEVAPKVTVYVPPFWIHRSVNVGAEPLVMSFCYPADAGQDYALIARAGGMATRILSDGAGWRAAPNPSYRPRGAEEIASIYASADDTG
ncbi:MAG: glucose-6-phosphate isomerase family protein [Pseudomonadota bacterium]